MNDTLNEIINEIYSFIQKDKCHFYTEGGISKDEYNPYYDGMLMAISIIKKYKDREEDDLK